MRFSLYEIQVLTETITDKCWDRRSQICKCEKITSMYQKVRKKCLAKVKCLVKILAVNIPRLQLDFNFLTFTGLQTNPFLNFQLWIISESTFSIIQMMFQHTDPSPVKKVICINYRLAESLRSFSTKEIEKCNS